MRRSITTAEIVADNEKYRKVASDPSRRDETVKLEQIQGASEKQLLASGRVCLNEKLDYLQDRLGSLDPSKYTTSISKKFYNSAAMAAAMCTAESIVYTAPSKGSVTGSQRVRHYIRKLKQIGAESVEGYAMLGNMKDEKSTFVLKAPRNPASSDLLHEYFVGSFGLNKLRASVPNFAYVFGGFKCSPPIIGNDKEVKSWCGNPEYEVDYIVYENIAPSVSLREYVENGCTGQQWLNIYMQVLYSLSAANKEIDFTHYDLHDENVLVRSIPSQTDRFSIPYTTENGDIEYIEATEIGTIIDFGFSHIKYQGKDYGIFDRFPWGVFPRRSFPLHDAYKLLLMSMRTMYSSGNEDCFRIASQILQFFNAEEDPVRIVTMQSKYYYYLPFIRGVTDVPVSSLTRYIRAKLSSELGFIRSRPIGNTIGCDGTSRCDTYREALIGFGFNDRIEPGDVFEFYDVVSRLKKEGRDVQAVVNGFDHEKAMRKAIAQFNKLAVTVDPESVIVYTVREQPVKIFNDGNILTTYREFIGKVAALYDAIQELNTLVDSMEYVANIYGLSSYFQYLSGAKSDLEGIKPYINEAVRSIHEDIGYIRSKEGVLRRYLRGDFTWWLTGPNLLASVIRV